MKNFDRQIVKAVRCAACKRAHVIDEPTYITVSGSISVGKDKCVVGGISEEAVVEGRVAIVDLPVTVVCLEGECLRQLLNPVEEGDWKESVCGSF